MPSSLQYMEKLSQLAYHPLKMQSCYEKMEPLRLDGLQQRFDVSSTSVFKQRAQIHMREQMDNAVYTFETLLHQELGKGPTKEELCKSIQRILERVLKKYDYDSSTVRKRFFREALLQITIPFLLKKLAPTCKSVSGPSATAPLVPGASLTGGAEPTGPLCPEALTTPLCPVPASPCRSCPGSRS